MVDMNEQVRDVTVNSPWRNSYWFARMLLNTDQYGAPGKKDALMTALTTEIEAIVGQEHLTDEEKLKVCTDIILNKLKASSRPKSRAANLAEDFALELIKEINSLSDIVVLIATIKYVVQPANSALKNIPSDDLAFCHQTAKNILDSLGEEKVGRVVRAWDSMGVRGCLTVERQEVIKEFTKLRANLNALAVPRTEIEDNAILTAFVQEFERRAGQKRKSRAGNSLEDIATFLFDYYGFSSHAKPDHFQTDIEVDKWFRCKDGWSVGISCKRTLRERWKQVSSADNNSLSRYKIKQIWHLVTYDRDLSDDKITMLGQQRQIFYLDDDSPVYKHASAHIGMRDYVRPLSRLISDIRNEQKG